MKVKDIMHADVISVSQEAPLNALVKMFVTHRIDTLPVVDKKNKLVGRICLDELITLFFPRYYDIVKDYTYVEDYGLLENMFLAQSELLNEDKLLITFDLMKHKVVSVNAEDSVLQAVSLMQSYGVNRVPVVDDEGNLSGIVSHIDMILALFRRSAAGLR